MKSVVNALIVVALFLSVNILAIAAVPPLINYQGKLMTPAGVPVADGTYQMHFAIYDVPVGGTALWSETNNTVQVKNGLYSVLLGSVINLPANIFDNPDRFFGVQVGADPEMTPRQQIASVPFAMRAAIADKATLADNATVAGNGVPVGGIIMWSGAVETIPAGWALCNGQNGTPDLRDRFIVCAGNGYAVGDKGGAEAVTLTIVQMPTHAHQELASWPGGAGGFQVQMTNTTSENPGQGSNNFTGGTGGNQSHENRPPYFALCFIMRVGN